MVPRMVLVREPALVGLPLTRPHLTRTIGTAHRRDTGLTAPAGVLHDLLRDDVARERHAGSLPDVDH